MKIGDEFYRYEDGDGHMSEDSIASVYIARRPILRTLKVTMLTREGGYIADHRSSRWVSGTAKRSFAYQTKELAWESYMLKKHRRVRHLEHDIEVAVAKRAAAINFNGDPIIWAEE